MTTSQNIDEEKPSSEAQSTVAQYLTVEFEMLHQRANLQEQITANRVNYFFVITTAIAGGLVLASNDEHLRPIILPAAFFVLAFLLAGGWLTLLQALDSHYSSTFFYRRAGRIRRWFLDHKSGLEPYLPFPVGDDSPRFYVKGAGPVGIDAILLLLNAGVAAAWAYVAFWLACNWFIPRAGVESLALHLIGGSLGLLTFVLMWILQIRKVRRFLQSREIEAKEKIRFPHRS